MNAIKIGLLACFVFLGGLAHAQETGPLAGAGPLKHQTDWRLDRLEVLPTLSASLGDTYHQHYMAGVSLNYFFLDWVGAGLDLRGTALTVDTWQADAIRNELSSKRAAVCPGEYLSPEAEKNCLDQLGVTDTLGTRSIQLQAMANMALVPLRGKWMFFGEVLQFDLHVLAGFGIATLAGHDGLDSDLSIAPMAGIGTRWFVNDWITVVIQGRDTVMKYHAATDQDGREIPAEYRNHFDITLGVGFVFPQVPQRAALSSDKL